MIQAKYWDIIQQIKQRREALGMTQAQLARRAKMSQSAVAAIESGSRKNLRLETLERIFQGLEARGTFVLMSEESIEAMLKRRSREVAKRITLPMLGSAAIELQATSKEFLEKQIEETADEILRENPGLLWESE